MQRVAVGLAAMLGIAVSCAAHAQASGGGDPQRGTSIAAARGCTSCHGADGNGPVPAFPKLAGLQASYITKQLSDFKQGKRASVAMVQAVAELSAQDMSDLAAFFARSRMIPGPAGDPSLAMVGKLIYEDGNPATGVPSCTGCHSTDGMGSERYPRLASQSAEYLAGELKTFASGKRRNDRGLMQSVAERMTEREMKAVSEFVAAMPGPSQ